MAVPASCESRGRKSSLTWATYLRNLSMGHCLGGFRNFWRLSTRSATPCGLSVVGSGASPARRAPFRTFDDTARSQASSGTSSMTRTMSKRERSGGGREVLMERSCEWSYFPFGLVTAMTVALADNLHTSPAFATERVCCSIASWIFSRSCTRMLENSSMQQTPRSARTSAPASSTHSPSSFVAEHVSPAEVVPQPVVRTHRGASFEANRRNCDFPVPGSPTSNKCGVPRRRSPDPVSARDGSAESSSPTSSEPTPPMSVRSKASLIVLRR
mmetsp:Transcript_29980/g.101054  ORF Transcript_29980/g.101054 Transcript_29980/m.101054 type:complete len:271 (-) Transcript_29980:104-916(-)